MEAVLREEDESIVKQVGFKLGVKTEGVLDDESGELTEEDEAQQKMSQRDRLGKG